MTKAELMHRIRSSSSVMNPYGCSNSCEVPKPCIKPILFGGQSLSESALDTKVDPECDLQVLRSALLE